MTSNECSEILRFTQDDPGSVTLSDSEESLEICKMIEIGSVHRNELSLLSRMKNGIFLDPWALLTILFNKHILCKAGSWVVKLASHSRDSGTLSNSVAHARGTLILA